MVKSATGAYGAAFVSVGHWDWCRAYKICSVHFAWGGVEKKDTFEGSSTATDLGQEICVEGGESIIGGSKDGQLGGRQGSNDIGALLGECT